MRTTTDETTVMMDEDREGFPLKEPIPVQILFARSAYLYGEDADGNRGTVRIEYEILDAWIEWEHMKGLTSSEVEWALANAKVMFHNRVSN